MVLCGQYVQLAILFLSAEYQCTQNLYHENILYSEPLLESLSRNDLSSFSISDDMIRKWDLRTSYAYVVQCTFICIHYMYFPYIHKFQCHFGTGTTYIRWRWSMLDVGILFIIVRNFSSQYYILLGKTQTRRLSLVLFTNTQCGRAKI